MTGTTLLKLFEIILCYVEKEYLLTFFIKMEYQTLLLKYQIGKLITPSLVLRRLTK